MPLKCSIVHKEMKRKYPWRILVWSTCTQVLCPFDRFRPALIGCSRGPTANICLISGPSAWVLVVFIVDAVRQKKNCLLQPNGPYISPYLCSSFGSSAKAQHQDQSNSLIHRQSVCQTRNTHARLLPHHQFTSNHSSHHHFIHHQINKHCIALCSSPSISHLDVHFVNRPFPPNHFSPCPIQRAERASK